MIGSLLHQRYRIDAEIGQGGMGMVYRAHDTLLDRDVAVKVLNTSSLGTEGRARLLREAQAVAQLNHPNIVTVYDAGETDGVPFIVMELATGKSLHDFGTLTIPQVISTARQLCDALHYAHQHGTIHRDIKPENILILRTDDRLTAKLMDFGMAHTLGAEHMTEEGVIVGTALYLAPELIQGQTATVRSDLYALGVMLYECAAGRPPFTGENMLAILSQHLHAPVVPPSTFNDKIPPDLDQLLIRLMSKQPEDRPGSADEIRKTLEEIETHGVTRTPAVELPLLDRIVRGRLVARDHELEEANADWQKAIAGESRVLLISGEPGIGKTRFVRELMVQAQFQRASVLLGECYAEGGVPYAPIAQMIQGTDLSGLSNTHLAELIAIAPALQAHFPDVLPNPPLEPQANQQRLYDSVVEWCLALNKKAPVLLVLDDAHWADGGTLTLLRHLARRALRLRLRLLMTLTYREVELDEARALNDVLHDLNRERLATRLKLKRLDRDQTRDLLAVLFAEEITPELLDGIYRETEGNPFFIEEVCKALIEDGKIYRAGTRWGRPGMEEIDIPQSIKVAIQTRIAKLPNRVQDTLRLAAVLGREFDFDVFRMVSELDEEALIRALEQAERAQLIQEVRQPAPERTAGSPRFAFTHALIHSNLHESLSGLRRQRLHRQVAATLARMKPDVYEALAYHHSQAGDFELARAYSLKAGERALATYANQEAEKHFSLALELNGPDDEKAQALSGLGKALYQQDRFVEASERWHELIPLYRLLGDIDRLSRTYAWLSDTERQRGNIVEAISIGREGLAAVAGQPVTIGLATLLRETSNACLMHGLKMEELEEYTGFLRQALSICEELGDIPGQAETLARLGYGLAFSPKPDPTEGARLLEKAIRLAEGAGIHTTGELACNYLAQVEAEKQMDFQAAIGHLKRAIQHCLITGSTSREIFSLGGLAYIYMELGNLQEADKLLERGRYLLGLIDNTGAPALVLRTAQAVLLYRQGEWATAAQKLKDILVETQQQGNLNYFGLAAFNLGFVLIDMQAYDEVNQLFERARPFLSTAFSPGDFYNIIIGLLQQGNLEQARDFLERARALSSTNFGVTDQSIFLLEEALVEVEERRWPKAFEGFKTAAQNYANAGLVWELAHAQRRWAEAHLRRGKPKDIHAGRELLGEALALYEKMGAIKHAEVLRERLKAIG
jgi:tetratricopeptide (TPR) repeat protein